MRKTLLALAALTPLSLVLTSPAQAEPVPLATAVSWTADLSAVDSNDSNVRSNGGVLTIADERSPTASVERGIAMGILVLTPKVVADPVNRVAAAVTGAVPGGSELAIDVRGVRADGEWSEWTEARPDAPAVLAEPTSVVQVRAVLTAGPGGQGPWLRRIALTADTAVGAGAAGTLAAPLSYRIFATREGLVGGTTANGHVIKSRDHFVALPSRRGLAPRGTGDYSVKVCAGNGRCEWAPVWDVGPWNTKDDYWNVSSVREMWKNLPQGKPQAQAAFQDGYNGGRDQFGRRVANPAGIDLADGTFWDGLRLADNSWVTVTYLWTGSGLVGQIRTAADPLNVRSGASASTAQVGLAANYARVHVECQIIGDSVSGTQGTSRVWFRISPGKFVAKAYVAGVGSAASC